MKVLKFIYNKKEISFEPSGKNMMVNATEMAKVFGKRIDFFLKTDQTKSFIKELEFTPFGGNSEPLKREEIIQTRGQSGTWMHRILALKFAAWLDIKFELWVYTTIDQILLGHFSDLKQATVDKLKKQKEYEEERERLVREKPELASFFELEMEVKNADKRKIKAMKQAVGQLKFDLFS